APFGNAWLNWLSESVYQLVSEKKLVVSQLTEAIDYFSKVAGCSFHPLSSYSNLADREGRSFSSKLSELECLLAIAHAICRWWLMRKVTEDEPAPQISLGVSPGEAQLFVGDVPLLKGRE